MKYFIITLLFVLILSLSVSSQYASATIYDGTKAAVSILLEHASTDQLTAINADMADMVSILTVISDKVGSRGQMTQQQLLDLQSLGHEIMSHSSTHAKIESISPEELYYETVQSKTTLENMGFNIYGFIAPYNKVTTESFELIQNNYEWTEFFGPVPYQPNYVTPEVLVFSKANYGIYHLSEWGVGNGEPLNTFSLVKDKIDYAIANKLWVTLNLHGINTDGGIYDTPPELFTEITQYIREQRDLGNLDVLTRIQGLGLDDDASSTFGSATIFTKSDSIWIEQTKLAASDKTGDDRFGQAVSISGDTAVVGSYLDDGADSKSGTAYVFTKSNNIWTQQAKLTAYDAAPGDRFGYSVAVSGDTIVVGSYLDDGDGSDSGSAYIFTKSGSTWTQQAKLTASDSASGDRFGRSVSISGDTIVVGSYHDDEDGIKSGSAYVFARSDDTWTEQAKLTAYDAASGDCFGRSVSISGDTIVVGSYHDDESGIKSGSAYIFTKNGSTWTEQAKLIASDATANDEFGWSVSISEDTAIVGAPFNDKIFADSGAAYVFTRSDVTWTEQAKLIASDPGLGNYFGMGVTIEEDMISVGSMYDDKAGNNSGSAYVFTRSDVTWTEQITLTASDAAFDDRFGWSLSLSGNNVLVGSHLDDDYGFSSGSAYIFNLDSDTT